MRYRVTLDLGVPEGTTREDVIERVSFDLGINRGIGLANPLLMGDLQGVPGSISAYSLDLCDVCSGRKPKQEAV